VLGYEPEREEHAEPEEDCAGPVEPLMLDDLDAWPTLLDAQAGATPVHAEIERAMRCNQMRAASGLLFVFLEGFYE
jgi:hypothetical protein